MVSLKLRKPTLPRFRDAPTHPSNDVGDGGGNESIAPTKGLSDDEKKPTESRLRSPGGVLKLGLGSTWKSGQQYLNHNDIRRHAIQIYHSEEAVRHRGKSERSRLEKWVIHPNNRFRRTFDGITVVWVLLLVFAVPFEIGFDWYIKPEGLKIFMNLLDVWFAVDIMLNFRTGYVHHGTIVMTPKRIFLHYLRTWFIVDLMGTLPFEKFIRSDESSRKSIKLIKYFKIPKLIRLAHVVKYIQDHKNVYYVVQVFSLVFICLHIGACAWVDILGPCVESAENYTGNDACAQENWYRLYVEALHLSTVMILGVSNVHIVGASDTLRVLMEKLETDTIRVYLFSTLCMVGGLFVIALLMGQVNVFIMGKMQGSAAFQNLIDRVNHELEYYSVPDDLQLQVKAYYDYVWLHQKQYGDRVALLNDKQMSTDLQRKLALHLFKDVVSDISLFSGVDDLLLGEICLSLKTRVFLPEDMILYKGDIGKELFIISKGKVEVLRDDLSPDERRRHSPIFLQSGSFFGEVALIMEQRRSCSVQARTMCEVNILDQVAFDAMLQAHPHFARKMYELVVSRQLEMRLTRYSKEGIDFKVRKSDIDFAVEAVEQNRNEGLERRTKDENRNALRRNPTDGEFGGKKKVSFATTDTDRTNDEQNIEEADKDENSDWSNRATSDVSSVFDDILRRSRLRSPITKRNSGRSTSDSEEDAHDSEYDDEASQTSRATGHFSPNKMLDLTKVHPSIFTALGEDGGDESYDATGITDQKKKRQSHMKELSIRVMCQDKLIDELLARIETKEEHPKEETTSSRRLFQAPLFASCVTSTKI